ncbi:hypothetical protein OKJ48_14525 [Streptomyces kunmingensis]|uniref:Secreted protein n=1 Tax=Streptomyces kunmingensis TaxID=68225 RepID=A0ABU6C9Z6_9ACTN|nr:hypothetical protein [Streptomyces kunmingensis]MEB3961453.1 hypothetical protein [Streptomyces kunmingensis]
MATVRKGLAALTASAGAAALLVLGAAPQAGAAEWPGVTFYTGVDGTGTAIAIDTDQVGVCRELPAAAKSYTSVSERGVDVFFNPDCRTGAPGTNGDIHYVVGTLNTGDFPYPAVSYRVRAQ